jgi:ribosomal protein S18 acetylase RimI-like enzyme
VAAVSLQPASSLDLDSLTALFNTGYTGYSIPVQINADQLRHHIEQNTIDLNASQIAIHKHQAVGIVLLARRAKAGWIGGLGVNPESRGQGMGRALMEAAITLSQQQGLHHLQLEVIVGNETAHGLYQCLGFQDMRELLILERPPVLLNETADLSITAVPAHEALQYHQMFHTAAVPWQRDHPSLLHAVQDTSVRAWLVAVDDQPAAYALGRVDEQNLHFLDLAVASGHAAALRAMLLRLHQQYPQTIGHIVNLDTDEPAAAILQDLGYRVILSQNEMRLTL